MPYALPQSFSGGEFYHTYAVASVFASTTAVFASVGKLEFASLFKRFVRFLTCSCLLLRSGASRHCKSCDTCTPKPDTMHEYTQTVKNVHPQPAAPLTECRKCSRLAPERCVRCAVSPDLRHQCQRTLQSPRLMQPCLLRFISMKMEVNLKT